MVGVPKSTGCQICRRRKIKCDEAWPRCANCQKNGKACPGPPDNYAFRTYGPKVRNGGPVPNNDITAPLSSSRSPKPHRAGSTPQPAEDVQPGYLRKIKEVRLGQGQNGAVYHKFRISTPATETPLANSPRLVSRSPPKPAFLRHPSPSSSQALSRALVETLSTGGQGQRMSAFGRFMFEIPRRVGHNPALDAAVACLVHAHRALVHKRAATEIANPRLYLGAIQALQTSLETRREGMSANTLCASVLLGLVEAMAGPRTGNRYLAHVGGAGRLMEIQGPNMYQDPFAKEILRFNRGGVIITSIYERKQCFLISPQWKDVAFDKTGLNTDDVVYSDLLCQMADFPALLKELKALDRLRTQGNNGQDASHDIGTLFMDLAPDPIFDTPLGDCHIDFTDDLSHMGFADNLYGFDEYYAYSTARAALLDKLQRFKDSLAPIEAHMNFRLANNGSAEERPSVQPGNPIRVSYRFVDWRVSVAYNCFWSLVILTNRVILKLLDPLDPSVSYYKEECRTAAYQICKTWEDAWDSKPIGAFHTGLSFVLAYEWCTPDVQVWIIDSLNALLKCQMVDTFCWSDDVIRRMSGRLVGEGPDLVFKHGKGGLN